MNALQQEQFEQLFTKYGSPCKDVIDKTLYLHFYHPEKLDKVSEVARYDKRAAEDIADLERYIEQLKVYRVALAERYNYIATAPTTPVVELKRYRNYSTKKVTYYLNIYTRDLNTNKDTLETTQTYPGTDRKQALKDYEKYIASHPGIIAIKDIEKSRWE